MAKILMIGEINVDLIHQGYNTFPTLGKEILVDDFTMTLGSATAICAVGLAKLGNQVAFLGKVGKDLWGDYCVDFLKSQGIDVSRIIHDPTTKTGITTSISSTKDRALVTYLGAILALSGKDITEQSLEGFQHVHISSYFIQENLRHDIRNIFALARKKGLTTSLDPGFDPTETWSIDIIETLKETSVFFPNEVEAQGLGHCQDFPTALRNLQNGYTQVVLKLGSKGCMTMDKREVAHLPVFPVKPVDTTGAGDSFNAGFLHAWLQKLPLRECMRYGAAAGALSTLGMGGTACQPTLSELENFLKSQ